MVWNRLLNLVDSCCTHAPKIDLVLDLVDFVMEIMTIDEVAAMLRMSKRSVYEMTSGRGRARMKHPLPVLRINSSVRFLRKDVEAWIEKLAANGK